MGGNSMANSRYYAGGGATVQNQRVQAAGSLPEVGAMLTTSLTMRKTGLNDHALWYAAPSHVVMCEMRGNSMLRATVVVSAWIVP